MYCIKVEHSRIVTTLVKKYFYSTVFLQLLLKSTLYMFVPVKPFIESFLWKQSRTLWDRRPPLEHSLLQTLICSFSCCHEYACARRITDTLMIIKSSNYFCGCCFSTRLVKIKEWVDSHDPGALVIPFSGGLESQLQDMSEDERQAYCTERKTQRLISIQSPHTLLSAVSSMHSFNCMCW